MVAGALFASACDDESDSSDSMRAGSGSGAKSGAGGSGGSPVHAGGSAGESSPAHGGGGARGDGDVCRTEAACGDDGIAFLDCPSKLSDLDLTCERYITIDRYQGCGQIVLAFSNGVQASQYTFAADGQLLGTYSYGDVGDHACFGEPCRDLGEPEVVCDGVTDGGAGGGPNGGGAGGFAGAGN